jgi:hypothetical protein
MGPTQPPIQMATEGSSGGGGGEQPGCKANHSPSTNAEVKKVWIYMSTPQYAFMV